MDRTRESRILEQHPGLRDLVESFPLFLQWRSHLQKVDVDSESFWVVRGDQLMDNDQIVVEWIRLNRPELIREEP